MQGKLRAKRDNENENEKKQSDIYWIVGHRNPGS